MNAWGSESVDTGMCRLESLKKIWVYVREGRKGRRLMMGKEGGQESDTSAAGENVWRSVSIENPEKVRKCKEGGWHLGGLVPKDDVVLICLLGGTDSAHQHLISRPAPVGRSAQESTLQCTPRAAVLPSLFWLSRI